MSEDIQRRQALANFLRTRRARLSPADVGFQPNPRRRTPGLRREEVAALAHVGISWYTALEQGHDIRPSEAVLQSLANILQLSVDERRHLFVLACQQYEPTSLLVREEINPALHYILQAVEPNPAYILGSHWDYLAWNDSADLIFGITQADSIYARNLVWQLFTNPRKRHLYKDWEQVAQHVIGEFRAESEQAHSDPWFRDFVADLQRVSCEFLRLWQHYDVIGTVDRRKAIQHPQGGTVLLEYTTMRLATQPTLRMIMYTPVAEALALPPKHAT